MKTCSAIGKGSRLQTIAAGMVLLAVKNKKFRAFICRYLFDRELLITSHKEDEINDNIFDLFSNTQPIDERIAESKLAWLLKELNHVSEQDRFDTLRILGFSTLSIPEPKAAAWGILFNQTLGLTRGNPDFSSGLEYSQEIILSPSCRRMNNVEIAKVVTAASAGVLSKCLEDVGYDFRRLEPEVVLWLSESRTSVLYGASRDCELHEIVNRASSSGVSFFLLNDGATPNVIALQPSVAGSHYKIVEGLTPLS